MPVARRTQLADRAALDKRIDQELVTESGHIVAGESPFEEKAACGRRHNVRASLGMRQQVELVADSLALAVSTGRPQLNFPEHRAPSSPRRAIGRTRNDRRTS